jgi:DnaK suppressor protein
MSNGPDEIRAEEELRALHREIERKLAELTAPPEAGANLQFGKRIGDGTIEAVSRLTETVIGRDLVRRRERVERALAKLAAGSYGYCDSCGEAIDAGRLRALPDSVCCVACAGRSRSL